MDALKDHDVPVAEWRPPRAFTASDIRVIIANSTYRGAVRVRKAGRDCLDKRKRGPDEYDEYRGRHTPLVSDELWFRANRVLGGPRKLLGRQIRMRKGSSVGLLQGLLVCGCCDYAMSPGVATKKKRTGGRHRYYRCSELVKRGAQSVCTTRQISCDALESAVITLFQTLETSPASYARLGFDPTNKKREEEKSDAHAEMFRLDSLLLEKQKKVDNFVGFLAKEGSDAIAGDVREAGMKAKEEIATIEYARIQAEHRLHVLSARIPQLSQMCRAFGRISRALQISDAKGKGDTFRLLIRSIILRRVSVFAGPEGARSANKRTFRMAVEFRTDEVVRFGEVDPAVLMSQEKFNDIVLKATFEIHSNAKGQRIVLLETNYSAATTDYTFQPPGPLVLPTKESENPVQRATRWKRHLLEEKLTITSLAAIERVSKGLISQHLALLDLPPLIVDFLKDGRDREWKKKVSLRELQRLMGMTPNQSVGWFHSRMSGIPYQEVMQLAP